MTRENDELRSENKYLRISLKRIETSYVELECQNKKLSEEIVNVKVRADRAEINERRLISEVGKLKVNHDKLEKQFDKLQADFDAKLEVFMADAINKLNTQSEIKGVDEKLQMLMSDTKQNYLHSGPETKAVEKNWEIENDVNDIFQALKSYNELNDAFDF